jgi:hypothetical protein
MPIARQRVAEHILAEANARDSRSIARQRRGKQALSTIQAVFSVGSVQSGYKSRGPKLCYGGMRIESDRTRMERVLGSSL